MKLSLSTGSPTLWTVVGEVETELGGDGRVLVRPSGTEPVVRVMVEAASESRAADATARIVAALETDLGLS